jgi:hypothetical protein
MDAGQDGTAMAVGRGAVVRLEKEKKNKSASTKG